MTIPIHAGGLHGTNPASPWLERWAELLRPGMRALDLACGAGRHVRWLSERGLHVTAVDRDATALAEVQALQRDNDTAIELLVADLEAGPWPLPERQFDLVLVTNYLWRPLLPQIVASVAPGGVLIYETFALGQETVGRPRNPEFLLQPGELLDLVRGQLRVIAYEDRQLAAPPRFVQRIAARREA
ncbi:MAG: class I SAM-dependent methyltransferase [Leptothrix sp. (in: b-proteobacteria)]